MAHDTALAGITLPDSTDVADVPTVLGTMVGDIETKLIVPMTHATRAGLSAAADGLAVWETDLHKLYVHKGTDPASGWFEVAAYDPDDAAWDLPAKPWGLPWGLVASATITTGGTFGGGSGTITTLTWTAVAGRKYRVSATAVVAQSVIGLTNIGELKVDEGATKLQRHVFQSQYANAGRTCSLFFLVSPSGGSHSYKLDLADQPGNSIAYSASADSPVILAIEDVGPA